MADPTPRASLDMLTNAAAQVIPCARMPELQAAVKSLLALVEEDEARKAIEADKAKQA